MAVVSKRARRSRPAAAKALVAGTYEGTQEVVEAVVAASNRTPAWRAVRAAAVMALAVENTPAAQHEHMRTDEFRTWVEAFTAQGGRMSDIAAEIGMAATRRLSILGGARIEKSEALACAHWAAGLPLPIDLKPEAFAEWFMPRFGGARAVARALGVRETTISDQMRGYEVTSAGRAERLPNVRVVRALDWCWRVGPFSPYGARLPAPAFPGQIVET